jgi:hypothetical protein
MAIIKNYSQWLNEDAQPAATTAAQPTGGTSGPGGKPGGFKASNGTAYGYPFKDEAALAAFTNTTGDVVQVGKSLLPNLPAASVTTDMSDPENPRIQKNVTQIAVDVINNALQLHALLGLTNAIPPEYWGGLDANGLYLKIDPKAVSNQNAATLTKDSLVKDWGTLTQYSTEQTKAAVAEIKAQWPKIWADRKKAAGLA